MKYIGIESQQRRNNFRSITLLTLFPCLVIALIFVFALLYTLFIQGSAQESYYYTPPEYSVMEQTLQIVRHLLPFVLAGVAIWFLIAYFSNTAIIRSATGAHALERAHNKRVYNIVENLCMSKGMKMPKINVIEDNSLNAYASGINDQTYTVTLSRGIVHKLNDDELEAVVAHELSHIRNRDVRLMIVSIVFVGIFAMLMELSFRIMANSSMFRSRNNKNGGGVVVVMIILIIVAAIGYFFSTLMRFAISRQREYLADAGSAEMTRKPWALASALRKISQDPQIEAVKRDDVAQLFIEHPTPKKKQGLFESLSGLFATHPPIEKRIEALENFES